MSGGHPPPERFMSVSSPCINLCRMSPQSGYCEGCLRSIAEITEWGRADDGRKRAILHEVARRKAAAASASPRSPS